VFVEYDRDSVLVPFLLLLFAMVGLFLLLRPDPSTSAGEAQEQAFEIAINGGTMSPEEILVGEGDRVNLRITAGEPLEFHLHGYGLEEEVEPDQPAELTFDATTTGRFEIENHLTDSSLGALLVQPR
jgi:heme/copper-type cytochrome/quinol oxidase subunit 2